MAAKEVKFGADARQKMLDGVDVLANAVKATLGHVEGDGALIVPDDEITWSGPPGVIQLSSSSEIQLVY